MDNNPIWFNDEQGDNADKDPKPKSKSSINNKSKVKKPEDWRTKYFGAILELQANASSWATEQSNKMTEAVHQVDAIMKPLKDEKIQELKVLYKIQAELGGSGLASGASIGTISTKSKNITVLGHYPDYVELANKLNAKRFQIPTNVWNKMSPSEQWAANLKFLDRMIKRGDRIKLATPISKVKPGSYYEKELKYLMKSGYKLNNKGTELIKF